MVAGVCEEVGFSWRALDVDSDDALRAQYTDYVPVVLIDGEVHGYWFVDADQFRPALMAAARPVQTADPEVAR